MKCYDDFLLQGIKYIKADKANEADHLKKKKLSLKLCKFKSSLSYVNCFNNLYGFVFF